MFTFGQIPTHGEWKSEIGVSDDKRALSITFADFQVTVGGGKSPAPLATRLYSLILPLEGGDTRAEIEFIVQGLVVAPAGATASIVCSVNGQTTVADFSKPSDESFVHKLQFAAERPRECRLCVFLMLGRDSKNTDVEAFLNVTSIDAELLPRPR